MEVSEAIRARRSIRRFKDKPVPREMVERILEAAGRAPSGKNLQPWRFVVLEGKRKEGLVAVMTEAIKRARAAGWPLGSTEGSARIMGQAPVTILVFDPLWDPRRQDGKPGEESPDGDRPANVVDIQSVGAAIQNMLLEAQGLGLGTLWICDVFIAFDEIRDYVGRADQFLIAAVAVGYADESPAPRARKPVDEVTEWLG